MKLYAIKTFVFIPFFILFYFEGYEIGGFPLSQIWKTPFLIAAGLYIIVVNPISKNGIAKYGYLWGIKNLFSYGMLYYPVQALIEALKSFNFAICYSFLLRAISKKSLEIYIVTISIFVIVSGLPFSIGLLSPLGSQYELENYGFENITGFVGIFQGPHYASLMYAISVLNLICLFKRELNNVSKTINVFLILLGIYYLIQTYARVGYLVLILGIVGLFLGKSGRKKYFVIFIVFVATISILYVFEPIYARMINDIDTKEITIQHFTSERTLFWVTNIENWYQLSIAEKIVGIGREKAIQVMTDATGFEVVSHNGFIDALIQNGILGLVIFTVFIYQIYRLKNLSEKENDMKRMVLGSYLAMQMVQGGYFFGFDLIIALDLAYISKREIDEYEINNI